MILFRAHRETPLIRERYDHLVKTSGLPVVVAWDSSAGNRGFEDVLRIDLSEAALTEIGLWTGKPLAWLCGDIAYYVAQTRFPEVSHFWLIEYDVLFSFDRASEFFAHFDGADHVDFLAASLRLAKPKWYWHNTMLMETNGVSNNRAVYRCFFPLTRLSAVAIRRLLPLRQKMFEENLRTGASIANDEAFVATVVVREQLSVSDLNAFGRTYYPFGYRFEWPIAAEALRTKPLNLVLHPVLDSSELRAKGKYSFKHLPLKDRVKMGLHHAYSDWRLRLANWGYGLPDVGQSGRR